jgi:tripartite-type tricarboxylate transporter receptor subunit TctC
MKQSIFRRSIAIGALFIGATFHLPHAASQTQPTLSVLISFAAGGTTDAAARILAASLKEKLGRAVVVENVPGAAGRIARARIKRSAPDGNTLLFTAVGGTSVMPHLYTPKNLGYVPADFAPVARVADFDLVLAASASVEASNVAELKAWMTKNPTLSTCANLGNGSAHHLLCTVLADELKIPMTHIPYRGLAPAVVDLLGNSVSIMVASPTEILPHLVSGKIKVLGTFTSKRSPFFPGAPTLKEQGIDLSAENFYGVWAPAGTPAPIIRELNAAIVSALNDAPVREALLKQGLRASPSSPSELAEAEKEDFKVWGAFVKRTGVTATE